MKRLMMVVLAATCVACSSTVKQTWKSSDEPSVVWNIEGEQSALGETVITINGDVAITGELSMSDGTGEFTGSYKGAALTMICNRGSSSKVRSRCVVNRGEERVAVLVFTSI